MAANETSKAAGAQQAANVVLTELFYFCVCFKTDTRSKCYNQFPGKCTEKNVKYALLDDHFNIQYQYTKISVVVLVVHFCYALD